MLELFTKHGGFDLKLASQGRSGRGSAPHRGRRGHRAGPVFAKALGDRKGINRAGYFVLPMDETLAVVALDLGGRPALVYKDRVKVRLVGDLQTELVEDFFGGFVNHAGANLHAKVLYGRSNHHKIEAIFKCFARAMRYACSKDARLKDQLPSTKGLSMIAIFDYGAGNLAVGGEHAGRDRRAATNWCAMRRPAAGDENHSSRRGPFRADDARAGRDGGARALIERIRAGVPFLGICLGLQALFESSEEAPEERGLGIFEGVVKRFQGDARGAAHGLEPAGARPSIAAA